MEPSGRNQWQPVANGATAKRLKQAKTVAAGCDQLPIGAHGGEGVDGSSPSEGSARAPAIGLSRLYRLGVARTCGGCGARCGAVRFLAASADFKKRVSFA
jgi:hypothetical protein